MALTPEQLQMAIARYKGQPFGMVTPAPPAEIVPLPAPVAPPAALPMPGPAPVAAPSVATMEGTANNTLATALARYRGEPDPVGTPLSPQDEARFQQDMRTGEGYRQWREGFVKQYGEEPNLNDPDYDYRAAWKAGIRPAPYEHDGGAYHWESSTPDGKMLKSANHPTAWMEHFMRATGKDPNELGLSSEAEGRAYLAGTQGTKLAAPTNLQEARAASAAATQGQLDAIAGMSSVAQRGAEAKSKVLDAQRADLEQQSQGAQGRADAFASERDRLIGEYNRLHAEADAAPEPADRRSTSQKVMGMIGLALTGLSDALAAGAGRQQNMMGDTEARIDQMVQRDIAAQKEAIDNKRKAADRKLNQLGMARQFFQDDQQAAQFVGSLRQQMYATELERQASLMSPSELQQKLLLDAGRIKQAAADNQVQLFHDVQMQRLRNAAALAHAAGRGDGVDWGKLTREELQALKDRGVLPAEGEAVLGKLKDDPNIAARTPGAQLTGDLKVRDPKLATQAVQGGGFAKLQDGIDTAKNALAALDRMIALRDENPVMRGVPWSDANDTLETESKDFMMQLKESNKLGVLNGPDLKLIEDQMGDPTGFRGGHTNKLITLRQQLIRKVNANVQTRGFEAPFVEDETRIPRPPVAQRVLENRAPASNDQAAPNPGEFDLNTAQKTYNFTFKRK